MREGVGMCVRRDRKEPSKNVKGASSSGQRGKGTKRSVRREGGVESKGGYCWEGPKSQMQSGEWPLRSPEGKRRC